MKGDITIRESRKEDLQGLLHLYTQLHEKSVPEETTELLELWEQIQQEGNYHIIVAEDGGRIVSSCVLLIVPNLTHGQRPYALIENVVTDQGYRNQGLASRCLDYAKTIAQDQNCYKIMLMTGSQKESTLRFYRKAGYNSEDKTAFVQWME